MNTEHRLDHLALPDINRKADAVVLLKRLEDIKVDCLGQYATKVNGYLE